MTEFSVSDLYASGQLNQAIELLVANVKKKPTDKESRGFLAELLCITGDLERADKQLEVLSNQDLDAAPTIALFRQLVRADIWRQEFYRDGRAPEFVTAPTKTMEKLLEASILLREGRDVEAGAIIAEAEEHRPSVKGVCNDEPFDEFRDMDDTWTGIFEVLTSTGKYMWVPVESVESIEFHIPERPRDVLWRRVAMTVRGGPDGEVFIPATYADPTGLADEKTQLGRATDWRGEEGGPVRGLGQRMFLVGEDDQSIMGLETLEFSD